MREQGGEGGGILHPKREGGAPPEQARTCFMRGLIQEMGGYPQDLRMPPPNARRSKGEGVGGERKGETRVRVGAPPPLGGRGIPEDQAQAIVSRIIKLTPRSGPHSGQTPAQPKRAQQTRGARGRGVRGRRGGRGDRDRRVRGRGIGENNRQTPPLLP